MNVSPTDGIGPTQGQRKTLTKVIGMFDTMMAMLSGWCNTCPSCLLNFFSTQIYVAHRSTVSGSSSVHGMPWETGYSVPKHGCYTVLNVELLL